MDELISKIESLLFVSNKPLSLKQLVKFSNGSEVEVQQAIKQISAKYTTSGIVLLEASDGYQFATSSTNSEIV